MRADLKFTYAEYATLPENGRRYQLIGGELLMSPAPTFRHQKIAQEINFALLMFVRGRNLGQVLFAPLDVILSDEDVLQPDIVFISNERRGIIVPEGLRGAPDLCVEILSPSNANLDRGAKRLLYARHGVIELWLVDPDANTLELFRLQENAREAAQRWTAAGTLVTALLPGFTLDLAPVFAA
jgi:Uma2 family endonuclease